MLSFVVIVQGDDGDEEEDEKKTHKRLEKGDYVIQVHIIEARELKARDAGDTSDPVCEVQVMGQKKSTAIHKELSFFFLRKIATNTFIFYI